ncbi:MAG TPA: FAD-binding oxidoreductase [Candidimonas sp.]|nr:FAD-binding oxidoreductase [Candidimonas sp.]
MPHTVTYPTYETRSGWNSLLPKRSSNTNQQVENSYDFVVIGAGFTGLGAARRLAELNPHASVLIIEASEIGEGSSARNSGFIISLPHNTKMSGHTSPAQLAKKQIRIYESGLAWLKATIDTHGIDCGWNPIGKYHGAATDDGTKSLQDAARQYDQWNIDYTEVSKAELAEKVGTSYYQYGLHTMNNVFVQPAALIRGLADTLPHNVTVLENCPVLSIDKKGHCLVRTKDHDIKAGKLILANNGFAKKLGFLKDRLITIFTYAGMTPELDDEQLASHGTDPEWGLIPANRLGTTLRKIQNRRFMVRSAYSYENAQTQSAVDAMLTDCYRRRYPALRSHRLEHVWGGVTALTRNGATFFGKASNNIYASVGCNGAGVLKGSVYGKLLAEMIMNQDSPELSDVLGMEAPSWLPPEPIRRMAVLTAIHLQKKKAGAER